MNYKLAVHEAALEYWHAIAFNSYNHTRAEIAKQCRMKRDYRRDKVARKMLKKNRRDFPKHVKNIRRLAIQKL
jgi:hypothetical protein